MRLTAVLLLCLPAALGAQTAADGALCERVGDTRFPEARATVQGLARTSGGLRGSFFAGCLLLVDGKGKEAAAQLEPVVRAEGRNAVAHFWLGRAYGEQAQKASLLSKPSLAKKTKNEFDAAVQLDPEYLDAREGLVEYYSQAPSIMGGSKDKARAQVEEIRSRAPYRGGVLAANLAGREKDFATVYREYQGLTTQFPDSAGAWLTLAYTYSTQKRYDEALATVERMAKALPGSMLPPYALGRVAGESGQQLDRGEAGLKKYLAYAPKPGEPPLANAHWRLGMLYERRGQKDAARTEYATAVSLDPKLTGARDALAKLK